MTTTPGSRQDGAASHVHNSSFSLIQVHHRYTGNINSDTSGDSENTFLHCGNVQGLKYTMKKTPPGLLSGENAYI